MVKILLKQCFSIKSQFSWRSAPPRMLRPYHSRGHGQARPILNLKYCFLNQTIYSFFSYLLGVFLFTGMEPILTIFLYNNYLFNIIDWGFINHWGRLLVCILKCLDQPSTPPTWSQRHSWPIYAHI